MTGGDSIFFLDDNRGLCNIIAFHKYDRITEPEKFRETVVKRISRFPRMRSCVTKCLGRYMYKDLGADALIKNTETVIQLKTGVHNEDQLADFMAKE